jgi:hypothetical protein
MSRTIIITSWDRNILGRLCEWASHGIDEETQDVVVLPQERIEYFVQECGAKYDQTIQEWVMDDIKH